MAKKSSFKKTRWYKRWVWVSISSAEAPFHALCLGAFKEVDCWYYKFQVEGGDIHNIHSMDVNGVRVSKADLKLVSSSVVKLK